MNRSWRCRWCGKVQPATRQFFCGDCHNGRTQRIEDEHNDDLGLPRRKLVAVGKR